LIDGAAWIFVLLQVFCVDLVLGVDNAVVIAFACSRLRVEEARRAVMFGALGAIALRLSMLAFANALLDVPLVKLVAAWTLIVIALNVRGRKADDEAYAAAGGAGAGNFLAAAAIIMLADAAMSLDNVVALAAIAGGNFWLLTLGVLLTIPIIAYGSLILTQIIRRAPEILTLGAVILGWIAGEMAVSDPLLSGWVQSNAPALAVLAPTLVAVFVWAAGPGAQRPPRRTREPSRDIGAVRPRHILHEPSSQPAFDARPGQYLTYERALRQAVGPAIDTKPRRTPALSGWSEQRVVVLCLVVLAALAGLTIFVVASLLHSFR
jgi:YjbE family integral membrane protein